MTKPHQKLLMRTKFGSHLYGTATEQSDTDFKSVVIPKFNFVISESKWSDFNSTGQVDSKNGKDDIDDESYSLHGFLKLCYAGDTSAIDMLHANSNSIIQTSPEWEYLVHNRQKFYTKNMSSYIGYCRRQAAKYCIKGSRLDAIKRVHTFLKNFDDMGIKTIASEPVIVSGLKEIAENNEFVSIKETFWKKDKLIKKPVLEVCESKYDFNAPMQHVLDSLMLKYNSYGKRALMAEQNEGVDWKAMHHALRAGYQARSIYKHGDFEYPLAETPTLMKVKRAELKFKPVAEMLEELVDEVLDLAAKSSLPESVDKTDFEKFKEHVYTRSLM